MGFSDEFKNNLYTLNNKSSVDFEKISKIYTKAYITEIEKSKIIQTNSNIIVSSDIIIETSFKLLFQTLYNIDEIIDIKMFENPMNLSVNNIDINKKEYTEKIIDNIFIKFCESVQSFWLTSVSFNNNIPPSGYISPSPGYSILSVGIKSEMLNDIKLAFFNDDNSFETHIINLKKFTHKHLLTISGLYNGLIPSTPAPIQGPLYPWTGLKLS